MDIGTAVAIGVPVAALCMSVAAVMITAIKTKGATVDTHTVEDGRAVASFGQNIRCSEHSGIEAGMKSLSEGLARIEKAQEEARTRNEEAFKNVFDLLREKGR